MVVPAVHKNPLSMIILVQRTIFQRCFVQSILMVYGVWVWYNQIYHSKVILKEIVEGKTDEDFERRGGSIEKAMCHTYKVDENKKFACYESLILYQKDNVRKKK